MAEPTAPAIPDNPTLATVARAHWEADPTTGTPDGCALDDSEACARFAAEDLGLSLDMDAPLTAQQAAQVWEWLSDV